MNAETILRKISSITTDFERGDDEAVENGLSDLKEMFSDFCSELRIGIDKAILIALEEKE
jgi:hypothetical protein